ncbi:MAG: retroviral-like aspartic protease family protein, partial [Candidatus Nitrosocosmicus sp.]|nr:retroviral-like aspartic protease family protein [Candidatus Nitrosocosmicus sp.]
LDFLYKQNRQRIVINFLIDTGAVSTMISWNNAKDIMHIDIKTLPKNRMKFLGIGGGEINSYILSTYQLLFASEGGWYNHHILNISVGDSHTTNGERCPEISSIIGMDIISQFKFSTDGNFAYLIK